MDLEKIQPFTKILPKGLLPIKGEPIIKRIMDEFYKNNFNNFNIILNHYGKFWKLLFQHKLNYNIHFYHEKTLGTVGYLYKFKRKFNNDIFLTNCDILLKANYKGILNYHKKSNNFLTICASIKKLKVPYGVCKINKKVN